MSSMIELGHFLRGDHGSQLSTPFSQTWSFSTIMVNMAVPQLHLDISFWKKNMGYHGIPWKYHYITQPATLKHGKHVPKKMMEFSQGKKSFPRNHWRPQAIGPNCSDPRGSRCLSLVRIGCCLGGWGWDPRFISHEEKGHLEVPKKGGDPSLIFPELPDLGGWAPRYSR